MDIAMSMFCRDFCKESRNTVIQDATPAGSHVVIIPPQFLTRMADHKYTRDTVRQFVSDAQKALERMQEVSP